MCAAKLSSHDRSESCFGVVVNGGVSAVVAVTALYLAALAFGAPLLAWLVFGGGGDGGDLEVSTGAAELPAGDGAEGSAPVAEPGTGSQVMAVLSLTNLAFVATFFGGTGLLSSALGASTLVSGLVAVFVGVSAGAMNGAMFAYLRRSESSSDVADVELVGSLARVTLPIGEQRRGRVALMAAGARVQMTAALADSTGPGLDQGDEVVIVDIDGGVAMVVPFFDVS